MGSGCDVLVAAPGEIDEDDRIRTKPMAQVQRTCECMCTLDRGNDALGSAEQRERIHCLHIGNGFVLRTADVLEVGVFRSDARVVETCTDRVRFDGLAVLEKVRTFCPDTHVVIITAHGTMKTAIEAMQRGYMIEDIQMLLSRHFSEAEIGEVTGLVNQLFDRRWAERGAAPATGVTERAPRPTGGKRHLH